MRHLAFFLAALLAAQTPPERAIFSATTNLVVVDVTVLTRDGKPVDHLTKNDFTVLEDGKEQELQSCDWQRLDTQPLPPVDHASRPPEPVAVQPEPAGPKPAAGAQELRDRRLIVLLFDFSSMQPPEQIRAINAAVQFLNTKMSSSDLVSIMTFASILRTAQDFTSDRDLLISTVQRFHVGEASDLAALAETGADPEDQSGMFVADDSEFNIFNTDRKLVALQDAARRLSQFPQKKALVYLSSGVEKTGIDNQSQLRATVNTAVRGNVAFYPIDVRGLSAMAPGGDATQTGAAGSKLYSGAGQNSLRDSFHNQQETLDSLAADTGGKALLDSNDLAMGITQVQRDISSYYVLTYASTNPAEDGRYRRIQVRLSPAAGSLQAKLDYRSGYYAPASFAKTANADREAQLARALTSENPLTDLPIAVEVDYFRVEKSKYFVPISVKIPGSALSFRNRGATAATELDFVAQVRDAAGKTASTVRDTIPLKLDQAAAGHITRGEIEYETGVTLASGKYQLRFVARENGEGKIGTFEAPFTVPDLSAGDQIRLSSVVLSNRTQPLSQAHGVRNNAKLLAENPLITSAGQEVIPNVTRVFRPGQTLHVYLEVYDPVASSASNTRGHAGSIRADLALYQSARKVMETSPIGHDRPSPKRNGAVPLDFGVPLTGLKPGEYECQINVIDQIGHKFAFPRIGFVLMQPDGEPRTASR